MPCDKSVDMCCPIGRFASIQVKSDDCRNVACYMPVCNNPCNNISPCHSCDYKNMACCVHAYINPCNNVLPCLHYENDCRKVACTMPVCDDPCNVISPCFDCEEDCGKVTRFVSVSDNSCTNPCNDATPCLDKKDVNIHDIIDDYKSMRPCGRKTIGRFPVIDMDPEDMKGAYHGPVCEPSSFNYLTSCHDDDIKNVVINNITGDCKGMQPSRNKVIGRFPVVNLDPEEVCYEPVRDHCRYN
ncbi:uncharacterized protein LOC127618972 [Xyrauchen texanus]|uniref:uncharacterized protein LOC127618972 n=1 Tax=Xyrauchen texanus TaxID=154827 RepID=UPI00224208B3|nr:uncharacterized protein LOC127618972 [Xyrauchen texanus]